MLDVERLLKKYCSQETVEILMTHGRMVAGKGLSACAAVSADADTHRLVIEAAYLHDIGVCKVHAPEIGCFGAEQYIRHGVLGREILEQEGLPEHALICERHTGVGIMQEEIGRQRLPLPERDLRPHSLAERIICYADLFYSKNRDELTREKSFDQIRSALQRYGDDKVAVFETWYHEFGG